MKIHAPAMTFKSDAAAKEWEAGLAKNQEPYGLACFRYASEWATRMERGMTGDPAAWIRANAKAVSSEADDEGITGFMYGVATSILAACWIHGEELRKWHNLDTQIGNEGEKANASGGVLNPALLSIG